MRQLITSIASDASAAYLYHRLPGGVASPLTLPTDVSLQDTRPCFVPYRDRVIILGAFNPGLIISNELQVYKLGLASPSAAPTMAVTSGTVTGTCVCYVTARQKLTSGIVFSESGPSPASDELVLVTQGRSWTIQANIDTSRATHLAGWVGVNDTSPRLAWEREVGTTSVTESVPTLELAEELNLTVGTPPYCLIGENYHERIFYTMDPKYPDRIWYSEIGAPEVVGNLNFFRTIGNEPVTGIKRLGDELIVFTYNAVDVISGKDVNDFNIRRVSSNIGCLGHHTIVNIYDRLWFASAAGVYVYDGGFKYVSEDVKETWRNLYNTAPKTLENAFAEHDQDWQGYVLSLPGTTTSRFFVYYIPFEPNIGGGGAQPWWFTDSRTRKDTALGRFGETGRHYSLVVGSSDGKIRQENVMTDASDDSDAGNKTFTLATKYYHFDEIGGDSQEGKTFTRLWTFMQSESNAWRITFYTGDEAAYSNVAPMYEDVAASAKVSGPTTWVPKGVHWHVPDKGDGTRGGNPSGRGIILKYTITSPVGIRWRGFGGWWVPGPATRPKSHL